VTGVFVEMISLPFLPPKQLAAFYAGMPVYRRLGFLQWEDQKDHALSQDFADMLRDHYESLKQRSSIFQK
jgi:hypothetical protein